MFSFLIYGYIIYRIIKWLAGGDSESYSNSNSNYSDRRLNDRSFINALIAPIVSVVRLGKPETSYEANRILNFVRNTYIQNVFIDRMVMSAQNTFTNYMRTSISELTRNTNKAISDINNLGTNRNIKRTIVFAMFDVCEIAGGMNEQQREFIRKFCINIRVSAKAMYEEYMRNEKEGNYNNRYTNDSYSDRGEYNNYGYNNGGGYGNGYGYEYREQRKSENELEKAYKTLGLDKNATDEEIKAKKNKLLRKWHPDLYSNQGEEAIKKATQNSQKINEAYDIIKEARGMN